MDYAKEYDRMVEQSNRQQKEIEKFRELLEAVLLDVAAYDGHLDGPTTHAVRESLS